MKLRFPINADMLAMIEHSEKNPCTVYGETLERPSLLLVKDEGIYVMSAGHPQLPRLHADGSPSTRSVVVYAEGFDPNDDADGSLWTRARDAVGADDFGEPFDSEVVKNMHRRGATAIEIALSKSHLLFHSETPAPVIKPPNS